MIEIFLHGQLTTVQNQSNRYICGLCRQQGYVQPSRLTARTYSTESTNSPSSWGSLKPKNGDGTNRLSANNSQRLSDSRPIGGSTWGSPAFGTAATLGGSQRAAADTRIDDGLLPHERAARQRLAADRRTPSAGAPAERKRDDTGRSPLRDPKGYKRPHAGHGRHASHEFKRHEDAAIPGENRRRGLGPKSSESQDAQASARPRRGLGQKSGPGAKTIGPPTEWAHLSKKQGEGQAGKPKTQRSTGTNAFWQRFKDHVNRNGEGTERPAISAAENDMWDSLRETPGMTVREQPQPRQTLSKKPAKNEAVEEKPRQQRQREFDSNFQIERDARKRSQRGLGGNERHGKKNMKQRQHRFEEEDEDWDEVAYHRAEERRLRKAERKAQRQLDAMEGQEQSAGAPKLFLPEFINLSNLASGLKTRSEELLSALTEMGFENITDDSIFTGETAALIAMEFGFDATVDTGGTRDLRARPPPEDVTALPQRPPVVTIMGHVDHGKTTLLDWLRKSSVAAQEHGGITQHIGAFIVQMSAGKRITFLDTPGHAAFLTMRQRGANVTDIVVLVVAADDSVKPQTLEALKHARAAKVPMIVAINKIDKDDARPDQVKADLARHGVEIEDYGGDVQVVCVSGKTGRGMEDLEENIVTLSEILDVRAENDGMAEGWVLEATVKQVGKVANVLVKRGTLRLGDFIVAGTAWARVRLLRNEGGVEIAEAGPGTPVEVLGWRDELPAAGDEILQAPDEDAARTAVQYREEMRYRQESSKQLVEQEQRERERLAAEAAAEGAEDADAAVAAADQETGTRTVNFTVKGDVVGSVEAVCAMIQELGNHEVRPRILRSSAGQVSEFDVDHAATSGSAIVNFNNTVPAHVKRMADDRGVRVLDHTIIYRLTDDVKQTLSEHLTDNVTQKVIGEAEILQVFPINVRGRTFKNIAGCRIRNGLVSRSGRVRVVRRGEKIFDGKIDVLKHGKKDVAEMRKGSECGVSFEDFQDFQVGDQVQTYEEVREKRTL